MIFAKQELAGKPPKGQHPAMTATFAASAVSLGCLLSAAAQPEQPLIPGFDFLKVAGVHSGDMDLDDDEGSLAVSRFELRMLLSRPISPLEGLSIIPVLNYEFTSLDFNGTVSGFPIRDEDLHSISLSSFFIQTIGETPWFLLGWTRAEMGTDFQHIDGDDFTFDVALGAGYRFNDSFMIGIGGVILNLNGDTESIPGIFFDWIVSDTVRVGLYGPKFLATYAPDDCWEFSLRGDPGGGDWNIRFQNGESRQIDLSTYRAGLYVNRSITDNMSIEAGVGMTVGNEIEIKRTGGGDRFDRDLESGWYGEIGLRLKEW